MQSVAIPQNIAAIRNIVIIQSIFAKVHQYHYILPRVAKKILRCSRLTDKKQGMSVKTQELLRKFNECNLRKLTIESNFPNSCQINMQIINLFTQ